jgi:hypothetical protein
MDVVAHQAVSPHAQAVARGVIEEGGEVDFAIAVGEEDVLAAVAALSDVVRRVESDRSCQSCHVTELWTDGG